MHQMIETCFQEFHWVFSIEMLFCLDVETKEPRVAGLWDFNEWIFDLKSFDKGRIIRLWPGFDPIRPFLLRIQHYLEDCQISLHLMSPKPLVRKFLPSHLRLPFKKQWKPTITRNAISLKCNSRMGNLFTLLLMFQSLHFPLASVAVYTFLHKVALLLRGIDY
jgi:hypothetical protein